MKVIKAILILIVLLLLSFLFFWTYVQIRSYSADDHYLNLIKTDENTQITEEKNCFIISPSASTTNHRTLIFYPGGLVSPEAYLYKMGMISNYLNTTVFIIKAPFNAAIFNTGAAGEIINEYDIKQAWVGGHSLGGIAACRFVIENPNKVYGLYLFGAYCDQSIKGFSGPVILIMGKRDLIIDQENYINAKGKLPAQASLLEVEGLNHSDFGNYGLQKGDGESNLSNEEVINIIISVFED